MKMVVNGVRVDNSATPSAGDSMNEDELENDEPSSE